MSSHVLHSGGFPLGYIVLETTMFYLLKSVTVTWAPKEKQPDILSRLRSLLTALKDVIMLLAPLELFPALWRQSPPGGNALGERGKWRAHTAEMPGLCKVLCPAQPHWAGTRWIACWVHRSDTKKMLRWQLSIFMRRLGGFSGF